MKAKINKKVMLLTMLSATCIILIFCSIGYKNIKKQRLIENDSPVNRVNPSELESREDNSKEAMYDDITVLDNEEIEKRYKTVNKKYLTYDIAMKNEKDYFYEFKNGVAYNHNANKDLKPINNKKYAHVLLGYNYVDLDSPFTHEEAIAISSKVLPDDIKIVDSKVFDDEEYIHYKSSKGNFMLRLGYEKLYDVQNVFTGINKDRIDSISYLKAIDSN